MSYGIILQTNEQSIWFRWIRYMQVRLDNTLHPMFCLILSTYLLDVFELVFSSNSVVLHCSLEWSFEDHWQKEEHFQTGPRRVHRSRKDRECLHPMQFSCSSLCTWGQFAGKQQLVEMNDFNDIQGTFGEVNILYMSYFQSCLVAIVVPDAEILPTLAEKLGVKGSMEELCKNQVWDPVQFGFRKYITWYWIFLALWVNNSFFVITAVLVWKDWEILIDLQKSQT